MAGSFDSGGDGLEGDSGVPHSISEFTSVSMCSEIIGQMHLQQMQKNM